MDVPGATGDDTGEYKTEHKEVTIAAINPKLLNCNSFQYIVKYGAARRDSVGGGMGGPDIQELPDWYNIQNYPNSNESEPSLTFQSLASWELWARTDPMRIGSCGYFAHVLKQDVSAGDVKLQKCNWAKPGLVGSRNEKGYGEPGDTPSRGRWM